MDDSLVDIIADAFAAGYDNRANGSECADLDEVCPDLLTRLYAVIAANDPA